jgi:hypothetical protein
MMIMMTKKMAIMGSVKYANCERESCDMGGQDEKKKHGEAYGDTRGNESFLYVYNSRMCV